MTSVMLHAVPKQDVEGRASPLFTVANASSGLQLLFHSYTLSPSSSTSSSSSSSINCTAANLSTKPCLAEKPGRNHDPPRPGRRDAAVYPLGHGDGDGRARPAGEAHPHRHPYVLASPLP